MAQKGLHDFQPLNVKEGVETFKIPKCGIKCNSVELISKDFQTKVIGYDYF